MSEVINEETNPNQDPVGQAGGQEGGGEQKQVAWSPSQEEFTQLQESVKAITGFVPTLQQVQQIMAEQQTDDLEDLDIDQYIELKLQERIAPLLPAITSAAQRTGQERMKSIFEEEKKVLGDFDETLAERVAHAYFAENPNDPARAVKEAAKYAAEVRKAERKAGEDSYKESLRRGPGGGGDLPVNGGGDRTIPAAKTYDEVIERYAGQTEV